MVILCVILANCLSQLLSGNAVVVVPCVILTLLCSVCVVIIWRQPESKEALTFKVAIKLRTQPACCRKEISVFVFVSQVLCFWKSFLAAEWLRYSLLNVQCHSCTRSFILSLSRFRSISKYSYADFFPILHFSVLSRSLCSPGCPCSVFSSTSTSWCSWTWVHGAASPSGWLSVRLNISDSVSDHFSCHTFT